VSEEERSGRGDGAKTCFRMRKACAVTAKTRVVCSIDPSISATSGTSKSVRTNGVVNPTVYPIVARVTPRVRSRIAAKIITGTASAPQVISGASAHTRLSAWRTPERLPRGSKGGYGAGPYGYDTA